MPATRPRYRTMSRRPAARVPRRRTGRDPARDHRPERAVPAPAAHQPGVLGRAALRHARGDGEDLRLDPANRRVRTGPAEIPPHGLPRLGGDRRPPRRLRPRLRRLRYLRRAASRAARQAPAQRALPVVDPGRRPGTAGLGRAGPPAVPLVARSGQRGRLTDHPPPAAHNHPDHPFGYGVIGSGPVTSAPAIDRPRLRRGTRRDGVSTAAAGLPRRGRPGRGQGSRSSPS